MTIFGTIEPGFESARALFAANVARGVEENAQLCVYTLEMNALWIFWGSHKHNVDYNAAKHFLLD